MNIWKTLSYNPENRKSRLLAKAVEMWMLPMKLEPFVKKSEPYITECDPSFEKALCKIFREEQCRTYDIERKYFDYNYRDYEKRESKYLDCIRTLQPKVILLKGQKHSELLREALNNLDFSLISYEIIRSPEETLEISGTDSFGFISELEKLLNGSGVGKIVNKAVNFSKFQEKLVCRNIPQLPAIQYFGENNPIHGFENVLEELIRIELIYKTGLVKEFVSSIQHNWENPSEASPPFVWYGMEYGVSHPVDVEKSKIKKFTQLAEYYIKKMNEK